MAQATQNVSISKMAYIRQSAPDTHYTLNSSTWYFLGYDVGQNNQGDMLIGLASFPSSLKHNKLYAARIYLQLRSTYNGFVFLQKNKTDFDASAVTWETQPDTEGGSLLQSDHINSAGNYWCPTSFGSGTSYEKNAAAILQAPSLRIKTNQIGVSDMKTGLSGGGTPYAQISYDDSTLVDSQIQRVSGPNSGYSNPRNATVFSWDYVKSNSSLYCAVEEWDQASAIFYWKESSAGSYTAVSISGNVKSTTIAANTFPTASTIQWYVEGTDEDGTTTQTPVYSFSTAASTVSAIPVEPKNSVEDGSDVIRLSWNLVSADGQAPSRVVGEWKKSSDNSWTSLFDESSPITFYDVPANTFTAGSIDWRVEAYNIDGTVGTWESASFVSVAAPLPVAGLAATAVPLTTVTWQTSEQQAYQVSVDGEVVKRAFGDNVYSWQADNPLEDGLHTISVIIQGQYGLWSQPSTVTINVQNTPDDTITLTGTFGIDAILRSDADETMYVYRDGVLIGKTNSDSFIDRLAIGQHSYYVEEHLVDGNYNRSNTVSGEISVDYNMIGLLYGDDWMSLKLSEKSAGEQTFSFSKQYSTMHVSGAVYPVLELGEYEDLVGGYDCAFNDLDQAKQFESFRGKPVILKSRGGNILFGAITQMQSHYGDFLTGYTFSIQRIEIEDFVDDTVN